MKRKTTLSILLCVFFSLALSTNAIPKRVSGATGTYELKTNPSDPFVMAMNTVYFSSGQLYINGSTPYYHQVLLSSDMFYLVIFNMGMNYAMTRASYVIFNQSVDPLQVVLRVSVSGFYTIKAKYLGYAMSYYCEVGIYQIPELVNIDIPAFMEFTSTKAIAWKTISSAGNYKIQNCHFMFWQNNWQNIPSEMSCGGENVALTSGTHIFCDDAETIHPITPSQPTELYLIVGLVAAGIAVVVIIPLAVRASKKRKEKLI